MNALALFFALTATGAPFEWQGATVGDLHFARAALLVPVELEGCDEPLRMQLDLGTGATVLYDTPMQRLVDDGTCEPAVMDAHPGRSLSVAGNGAVQVPIVVIETDDAGDVVGTVGSHFFRERILVVDFPAGRIQVLEPGVPSPMLAGMEWIPAAYRDPHLLLPVEAGGETLEDVVYDTGASLFPLVTTEARWRQLTGSTPDAPSNRVVRVPSWDSEVVLVGAKAKVPVALGSATLASPWVYFQRSGREDVKIENWNPPIDGLIGNVLFADDYTVAIDIGGERIGLCDPSCRMSGASRESSCRGRDSVGRTAPYAATGSRVRRRDARRGQLPCP